MQDKNKLLARMIADKAVRNSFLEDLHSGMFPTSLKGDYSDVKVVSPLGEIEWNRLSRISDEEMHKLMVEIESNIYSMIIFFNGRLSKSPSFVKRFWDHFFGEYGVSWDIPKKTWDRLAEKYGGKYK